MTLLYAVLAFYGIKHRVYQGVIYYQWEEILHSGAFEIKLSEQIVHIKVVDDTHHPP